MTREEILKDLNSRFSGDIVEILIKRLPIMNIDIKSESVVRIATYIFRTLGAIFNIASGVDTRSHIEILYHFIIEDINLLISLRGKLPKSEPIEIESLAPHIEATNWSEREIREQALLSLRWALPGAGFH